jgi:hypothetical protein
MNDVNSHIHTHDRHHATVSAEAARLERVLRGIGPMPKARLAHSCGAERWRDGTFQEAVREGLRAGRLRQLPLGWLEASRS